MRTLRYHLLIACLALALQGCDAVQYQALKTYMAVEKGLSADEVAEVKTPVQDFTITALTDDLDFPWGFDFLPNGNLLVTEKPGKLRLFDIDKRHSQFITGLPAVFAKGQGGLLDVAVHPRFDENQWIYLSAAVALDDELRTTRVWRFRLVNHALTAQKLIFEASPGAKTNIHFGSALLLDNEGLLYITMGDRKQRYLAQDLGTSLGKVLRYHDDGSIPKDNPFLNTPGALPEIFSYGHRNPQGITIDRATGRIWTAEHGPQGGDEINLLQAGANYGWPTISYGEEYGGGKIGEGTRKEGMQQPLHYYVPSIATGGIAWYDGKALPGWRGSLFVAGLRSFSISRVTLNGTAEPKEERLLEDFSFRARNVKQGPDGLLYLLTENGGILQIRPTD